MNIKRFDFKNSDFWRMIDSGKVDYTPLETALLFAFAPSKLGFGMSSIERLVFLRDRMSKFDFSVVNPDGGLERYLVSLKESLKKVVSSEVIDAYGQETMADAFALRTLCRDETRAIFDSITTKFSHYGVRKHNYFPMNQSPKYSIDFMKSVDVMKRIFGEEVPILSFGTNRFKKQGDDIAKNNFKVVVPDLDVNSYAHYIKEAQFATMYDARLRFSLIDESDFGMFQASDVLDLFSSSHTLLVQGEAPLYKGNLFHAIKLSHVARSVAKTRSMLTKSHLYNFPHVVRARRNEAYHVKSILASIFGEKRDVFAIHDLEKNFSVQEIKEVLVKGNYNLMRCVNSYHTELEYSVNKYLKK